MNTIQHETRKLFYLFVKKSNICIYLKYAVPRWAPTSTTPSFAKRKPVRAGSLNLSLAAPRQRHRGALLATDRQLRQQERKGQRSVHPMGPEVPGMTPRIAE